MLANPQRISSGESSFANKFEISRKKNSEQIFIYIFFTVNFLAKDEMVCCLHLLDK
jgi:hypothetical protein